MATTTAVVLVSAVIAWQAFELFGTGGGPDRMKVALEGVREVRQAAMVYMALSPEARPCPSLEDLVAAQKLSSAGRLDPWGTPYIIRCAGDEVRVTSAGRDRREGTGDDIVFPPLPGAPGHVR